MLGCRAEEAWKEAVANRAGSRAQAPGLAVPPGGCWAAQGHFPNQQEVQLPEEGALQVPGGDRARSLWPAAVAMATEAQWAR